MPWKSPKDLNYRKSGGNHLRWQYENQRDQQDFAARVKELSDNPGRHSGNQSQHATMLSLLQLITLMTSIRTCDNDRVIASATAGSRQFELSPAVSDNLHSVESGFATALYSFADVFQQVAGHISHYDLLKFPQAEAVPVEHNHYIDDGLGAVSPDHTDSPFEPTEEQPSEQNQYIGRRGDEQIVIKDQSGKLVELNRNHYQIINQTDPWRFVKAGQTTLENFNDAYYSEYPKLTPLAKQILKAEIIKKFKIDIDPDDYYFIRYSDVSYEGRQKTHYGLPFIKRKLTQCLFTNFGPDVQNNLQDMDDMAGIYHKKYENNRENDASLALNIKPVDFINMVWDINFYKRAKDAVVKFFDMKDKHIKKLFLDLSNNICIANLDNRAADDILNGVGIKNDSHVSVSFLDIAGYPASSAFVFENMLTEHCALYLPQSKFKFKYFDNKNQMRQWIASACADENVQKMIEQHFTLENRRDGVLFDGVDSWMDSISKNHRYEDKIARKPVYISAKDFFSTFTDKLKEKALSDADSLIKSDAEITREMWEQAIDASNVLANPISPFLSLGMHIEDVLNADDYAEQKDEWDKLIHDTINIFLMIVIDKAIKMPDTEGYKFINAVKEGIKSDRINRIVKFAEIPNPIPRVADRVARAEQASWRWLFDDRYRERVTGENPEIPQAPGENPEMLEDRDIPPNLQVQEVPDTLQDLGDLDNLGELLGEGPAGAEVAGDQVVPQIAQNQPLRPLFPLQEVIPAANVWEFNNAMNNYITDILYQHPWDVYYGFEHFDRPFPPYIIEARSSIYLGVKMAAFKVESALRNINNEAFGGVVEKIIGKLFPGADPNLLDEYAQYLKFQIERGHAFFQESEHHAYANFGIVSTKLVAVKNSVYAYRSAITDMAQLKSLPMSFTSRSDPLRRVFILYDAVPEKGTHGRDVFGRVKNNLDSGIIHEISHIAANTHDYFYNEVYISTEDMGSLENMRENFDAILRSGAIIYSPDFVTFMKRAYQYYRTPDPQYVPAYLNLLRHNSMLQAAMLMENADTFVALVNEISDLQTTTRYVRSVNESNRTQSGNRTAGADNNKAIINSIIATTFLAMRDHYITNTTRAA